MTATAGGHQRPTTAWWPSEKAKQSASLDDVQYRGERGKHSNWLAIFRLARDGGQIVVGDQTGRSNRRVRKRNDLESGASSRELISSAPPSSSLAQTDSGEEEDVPSHGMETKDKLPTDNGPLDRFRVGLWRACCPMALPLVLVALIYLWPSSQRYALDFRVAPLRPRPKFVGPLAINAKLDELGERMFVDQFHAPESMAWTRDRRAFYTGVEGGFILLVEPYAQRWQVAARLNGRDVRDDSPDSELADDDEANHLGSREQRVMVANENRQVPFCTHDVELYGPRAEFEPALVRLSRCSRPLGLRLAPDESRLYAMDPLSGLYRVDLIENLTEAKANSRPLWDVNKVVRLLDFSEQTRGETEEAAKRQVLFGDDIAVHWSEQLNGTNQDDVIYMTDCSLRWPLRYLVWMMLENDDTGRLLQFETGSRKLRILKGVLPVETQNGRSWHLDERGLSFPNGLELTANQSALLISDLNNRRILMHHLRGPLANKTELLMWVPGYSDNIKRGVDLPDGTPTYWFACGCAVSDGAFELAEFFNEWPSFKLLILKALHLVGFLLDILGHWLESTSLKDAGLMLGACWLKLDPYCRHGLVVQFDEQGQVLRSLHGPHFGSHFKLLSEAHQVALPADGSAATASDRSLLYLGSVYYSYLGRVKLEPLERRF